MPFILAGLALTVSLLVYLVWAQSARQAPRIEARDAPDADGGPATRAARALAAFEAAGADLKGRYPAVFSMLGGYLNADAVAARGGLEGAVREMLDDWQGRREAAARELSRLLAEIETEEEARAVVRAACDADFDREGYRSWLIWLLGRFEPPQ